MYGQAQAPSFAPKCSILYSFKGALQAKTLNQSLNFRTPNYE